MLISNTKISTNSFIENKQGLIELMIGVDF